MVDEKAAYLDCPTAANGEIHIRCMSRCIKFQNKCRVGGPDKKADVWVALRAVQ